MATCKVVESGQGKLNRYDVKSLAIGLGITLAGAALTYITEEVSKMDLGIWTPLIVAVWAFLVNFIKKFLTQSRYIAN
jgi:hypothetical protein